MITQRENLNILNTSMEEKWAVIFYMSVRQLETSGAGVGLGYIM